MAMTIVFLSLLILSLCFIGLGLFHAQSARRKKQAATGTVDDSKPLMARSRLRRGDRSNLHGSPRASQHARQRGFRAHHQQGETRIFSMELKDLFSPRASSQIIQIHFKSLNLL